MKGMMTAMKTEASVSIQAASVQNVAAGANPEKMCFLVVKFKMLWHDGVLSFPHFH